MSVSAVLNPGETKLRAQLEELFANEPEASRYKSQFVRLPEPIEFNGRQVPAGTLVFKKFTGVIDFQFLRANDEEDKVYLAVTVHVDGRVIVKDKDKK